MIPINKMHMGYYTVCLYYDLRVFASYKSYICIYLSCHILCVETKTGIYGTHTPWTTVWKMYEHGWPSRL